MKTPPKIDHYTYRIIWSEEDNQHVGLCAEFPSLSYLASTPEKAVRGIIKVVATRGRRGSNKSKQTSKRKIIFMRNTYLKSKV